MYCSPPVSDAALTALGPAQTQVPEPRQFVTCILCQEEQEVTVGSRAMVLAAFVQRSTVLSKDRTKTIADPGKVCCIIGSEPSCPDSVQAASMPGLMTQTCDPCPEARGLLRVQSQPGQNETLSSVKGTHSSCRHPEFSSRYPLWWLIAACKSHYRRSRALM